jgi:hypothetical protein
MKHDHVIDFLLRKTGEVLFDNLPPAARVPDMTAVIAIRALITTPTAETALEKGSDTERAFALRAIKRLLSDSTRPPREVIEQLWQVIDELDRKKGPLRTRPAAHANFWTKKPPAR